MYASKSFLEVPTEMSSVAGERGGGELASHTKGKETERDIDTARQTDRGCCQGHQVR